MNNLTELKLRALKKGDGKVFKEIFNTYWDRLFAAAYHRLQDDQQAQDIVQEVFVQLWDRREQLNLEPETLSFYLLRSIRNRVINYYYREKVREDLLLASLEYFDNVNDNEHEELLLEMEKFVNDQIEELPLTMKTIYLMREKQFPIKDIAIQLNLAEQTVKNNISEAQHRLRKALKRKIEE